MVRSLHFAAYLISSSVCPWSAMTPEGLVVRVSESLSMLFWPAGGQLTRGCPPVLLAEGLRVVFDPRVVIVT